MSCISWLRTNGCSVALRGCFDWPVVVFFEYHFQITDFISQGLDAPTTRHCSSVTLFDNASDCCWLVASTEQLRFVGLKLLCFSFLVWRHLVAAFVEASLVTWRSLVLFVSSCGPFNVVFTSGNQCPQLTSNCAKNSSHSVTLRLSRLCVSPFERSKMRSTLCSSSRMDLVLINTRDYVPTVVMF